MSVPDSAERAFGVHDAFERDGDAFVVTTTAFDGRVTASEASDWANRYTVTVRAPMLSAVTVEEVGPDLESGWFDTFERRLEDAPGAVRDRVELAAFDLQQDGSDAVVTFGFEWGNADRAPDIAKALAEYVEGTYMEGIVPGFDYREPVDSMLSAGSLGDGAGGTPL